MQLRSLSDCMPVHAAIVSIVVGGKELVLVLLCSAPLPSHAALQHVLWDVGAGKQEDRGAVVKVGSSLPLLCLKMNTV